MGGGRVLMTGGAGKLGRALLSALRARGASVAVTVRAPPAPSLGPDVLTEVLDLEDSAAIGPTLHTLVRRLGGIDVFIHAAGRTDGDFDALFAINVRAAAIAIEALREPLAGGQVILLGSAGAIKAMESPVLLTASHGALVGLARAYGKALGGQGTRVNLLAFGPLTDGASRAISSDLRAEYVKHACLRRQSTPEEAASAIASFALTNTYITGQTVVLDGGL